MLPQSRSLRHFLFILHFSDPSRPFDYDFAVPLACACDADMEDVFSSDCV